LTSTGHTPAQVEDVLDTPAAGPAAIRGGAARLGGYAVGIAASVGSAALLFRHLGVADSGHYVTVVTLATLAAGITDAGLSGVGVRELSIRDPADGRRLFANLFGIRVTLSALGVVAATVFALLAYPSTLVFGTMIAGVAVLLQTTQDTFTIPLLVKLRLATVTSLDVLRQVATALAIVALVLAGASLLPFWTCAVFGGLLAAVAAARLVGHAVPLRPAFHPAVWRPLLKETLPFALAAAVGAIYYRLALLVMSLVANSHQVGLFGASYRVVDVLLVLPQLVVGASFPIIARAARKDPERFDYATGRLLDTCFLLGLGVFLGLLTGAAFVIRVIAGPDFAAAASVLQIQAVALVGSFVAAVFGYALLGLHRYRETLVINLSVLLASGVLTGVLASEHGAEGAAVAVAIVELLYAVLLGVAVWRDGARPHVNVSAALRVLVAAGLGALMLIPSGLPDIVRPLLALAIYAVALVLLRAVPEEVLEQLPWRVRARQAP
jgi:O-antigen/teichoic acid export membrane protein